MPNDTNNKRIDLAAKTLMLILADAIREVQQIPSGHLYAILMGRLSLPLYMALLEEVKELKLVTEKNHLLRWIGPPNWSYDEEVRALSLAEPCVEDGHDWEGFPGGCQRMGCPAGCSQPRRA